MNLQTEYMGLKLANPVIAGASKLTSKLETIKKIEAAGAAAIVCPSLFEEQIQLEQFQIEDDLEEMMDRDPEMSRIFPSEFKHAGPREYLIFIKEVKEAVKVPVIASLNAVNRETWLDYSRLIEQAGVDGLELNFYFVPEELDKSAADIEDEQIAIFKEVKNNLSIPVAVKLSYFYSNPLNVIARFASAGADGIILFNRLFESEIDINTQKHVTVFRTSPPDGNKLPRRFLGLLFGHISSSLCASTSIYTGDDVIKAILAGASATQIVSTLYENEIDHIQDLLKHIESWMEGKGYKSINDFQGKLASINLSDPFVYRRAQYVDLILKSDELLTINPNHP